VRVFDGTYTPFSGNPRGLGRRNRQDLFNSKYRKYALSNLNGVNAIGMITTAICGGSENVSYWEHFTISDTFRAMDGEHGVDSSAGHLSGFCVIASSDFVQKRWIFTPCSEKWTSQPLTGSVNQDACRLFNFRLGRFGLCLRIPSLGLRVDGVFFAVCHSSRSFLAKSYVRHTFFAISRRRSEGVLCAWILAITSQDIDCDQMSNRVSMWTPTHQSTWAITAEARAAKVAELKRIRLPWIEEEDAGELHQVIAAATRSY
jgi:hypothetical protein